MDRSMLTCMSPMFCDYYLEVSLLTINDWNTTPPFLAVTRKRRIFCSVTLSLVLKHVALHRVAVHGAETSLRPKKAKLPKINKLNHAMDIKERTHFCTKYLGPMIFIETSWSSVSLLRNKGTNNKNGLGKLRTSNQLIPSLNRLFFFSPPHLHSLKLLK